MLIAKFVAPCPSPLALRMPALEAAVAEPLALLEAPAGYVPTGQLATLLKPQPQAVVWLRLGPEDADPGSCLAAFIGAVRRACPGIGGQTLAAMRHRPGPLYGWPSLFTQFAAELSADLPPGTPLVIENAHILLHIGPTLNLLSQFLLPAFARRGNCLIITHAPLPSANLPAGLSRHGPVELQVTSQQAWEAAQQLGLGLSAADLTRLIQRADGRAVVIASVLAAAVILGPGVVGEVAHHAHTTTAMLCGLARAWLAAATPAALGALALHLQMGYGRPALHQAGALIPEGPWTENLCDGWTRLHTIWREPLAEVLKAGSRPTLQAAAQRWLVLNAPEQAVGAYLAAGDSTGAAAALASTADELFDTGQWALLNYWLDQLPPATLRHWPKLEAVAGELAAVQGQVSLAEAHYASATRLYETSGDLTGAADSLLAESALAAYQGDLARAQACAAAAQALVEDQPFLPERGWSAWQLARLAASAGAFDQALNHLARAAHSAEATNDLALGDQIHNLGVQIRRQTDLLQQREHHRWAYFAADRAEREARARLREVLSQPLESRAASGAEAPGPLRLPILSPSPGPSSTAAPGLLEAVRGLLRRMRPRAAELAALPAIEPAEVPAAELPPPSLAELAGPISPAPSNAPPVDGDLGPPSSAAFDAPPATRPPATPAAGALSHLPTLHAYLLGLFRATLDDQAIERWPASRGLALFKYLIAHHGQFTPRDVLMDTFWPHAEPKAARNSLNVALSGLRRTLRSATALPVIVFEDNTYRLNPALQVWLDVDEFERHLRRAQDCEARQRTRAAIAEYRVALELYAGDFLADDPYEEWPAPARERLRLAHLEALDRLSLIHFEQGAYAACAGVCQRLLARDPCREDIHGRLMRCYARQGQHPLALRQYQACVEALRVELQVAPAPAIVQLVHKIRRHEPV